MGTKLPLCYQVPEDWSQIFFIGDLTLASERDSDCEPRMFAIWFVLDVVIRVSVLQCLYWKLDRFDSVSDSVKAA